MKQTSKPRTMFNQDYMSQAEKIFSAGLVNLLRARGHAFLEQGYAGSWTHDAAGASLLDCSSSGGACNLGRKNAAIVERFKKAIYETDQGNFVMPSQEKALLARRIADFVPGDLDCVLFGVTRGESMDAACKLARGFTARPGLVTVDGGCYGESGFALSLSARPGKEQFGRLIPEVTVIPFGDEAAAAKAIGPRTAAVVMEPIQAENHCRVAEARYYARVRALCDSAGAKLIFDETQSGFGRTGTRFFFEQLGVSPDILIVGEALSAGMFPMTAMVFTPELKHFFDIHPLIHLCTFGGHDLGCLVAMKALDEYERLEPWHGAAATGATLVKELGALADKQAEKVVSVSGRGLLLSLKLKSPQAAVSFCAAASQAGMLVETGIIDASTVVLRPSLLIGAQEAGRIVDGVAAALQAL